jgi:hypothetical protein
MIAGIKLELGGAEWVVPPLNLGALLDLQDRIAQFKPGSIDSTSIGVVVDCVHRALKRNYPDTSREFVAEHLDVANMVEVMQAVLDVSGLRRKKVEEEAKAQGEAAGA